MANLTLQKFRDFALIWWEEQGYGKYLDVERQADTRLILPDTRKRLELTAKAKKQTVSEWIRSTLNAALEA